MDADRLREELKDLHRGRGVRRPAAMTWIGPELQAALGLAPDTPDAEARSALVAFIREHTEKFPRDLRYLFLVATGIAVDAPMLTDRLELAEQSLDRSVRVLRRRLRVAEELLTESIVQSHERRTGPFEDSGWQWVEMEIALRLDTPADMTMTRTLLALEDGQRYIHHGFVIPGMADPAAVVTFEAIQGLTIVDVDHTSPNSWGVTMKLPGTLARGETLETALRVGVPDPRALNPYLAFAPIRPCRRARLSVDFGDSGLAREAWLLDAVYPSDASIIPTTTIDVATNPVVVGEFERPRIGLAYGVGWRWAD